MWKLPTFNTLFLLTDAILSTTFTLRLHVCKIYIMTGIQYVSVFLWSLCVRELIWWFGWRWWRSADDASASMQLLASSCVAADGRCFWACVVRQAAVRSFQNSLCACLPGAFVPQLTFPLAVAFNSFICLWFTEEYTQLNSVHGGLLLLFTELQRVNKHSHTHRQLCVAVYYGKVYLPKDGFTKQTKVFRDSVVSKIFIFLLL